MGITRRGINEGRSNTANLLSSKQTIIFRGLLVKMSLILGADLRVFDFCGIKNRDEGFNENRNDKYDGKIKVITGRKLLNGFNKLKAMSKRDTNLLVAKYDELYVSDLATTLKNKNYTAKEFAETLGVTERTYYRHAKIKGKRFHEFLKKALALKKKEKSKLESNK